jgi:hypothetical protein
MAEQILPTSAEQAQQVTPDVQNSYVEHLNGPDSMVVGIK